MCSLRGLWVFKGLHEKKSLGSNQLSQCLLFSHRFATVEHRISHLHGDSYLPLPYDDEFLASFCSQLLDDRGCAQRELYCPALFRHNLPAPTFSWDEVQEEFREQTWPYGPIGLLVLPISQTIPQRQSIESDTDTGITAGLKTYDRTAKTINDYGILWPIIFVCRKEYHVVTVLGLERPYSVTQSSVLHFPEVSSCFQMLEDVLNMAISSFSSSRDVHALRCSILTSIVSPFGQPLPAGISAPDESLAAGSRGSAVKFLNNRDSATLSAVFAGYGTSRPLLCSFQLTRPTLSSRTRRALLHRSLAVSLPSISSLLRSRFMTKSLMIREYPCNSPTAWPQNLMNPLRYCTLPTMPPAAVFSQFLSGDNANGSRDQAFLPSKRLNKIPSWKPHLVLTRTSKRSSFECRVLSLPLTGVKLTSNWWKAEQQMEKFSTIEESSIDNVFQQIRRVGSQAILPSALGTGSQVLLSVDERVSCSLSGTTGCENFIYLSGTVYCCVKEPRLMELSIPLVFQSSAYGPDVAVHSSAVLSLDSAATTASSGSLESKADNSYFILSCIPPCRSFPVFQYKYWSSSIIPVKGCYQVKDVAPTESRLLLQLRVHPSLLNKMTFLSVQLPFHQRGRIELHNLKCNHGSFMLIKNNEIIHWTLPLAQMYRSNPSSPSVTSKFQQHNVPLEASLFGEITFSSVARVFSRNDRPGAYQTTSCIYSNELKSWYSVTSEAWSTYYKSTNSISSSPSTKDRYHGVENRNFSITGNSDVNVRGFEVGFGRSSRPCSETFVKSRLPKMDENGSLKAHNTHKNRAIKFYAEVHFEIPKTTLSGLIINSTLASIYPRLDSGTGILVNTMTHSEKYIMWNIHSEGISCSSKLLFDATIHEKN